jgi:Na+/proline symporter
MNAGFGPIDQAIVVLYLAGMLGVGVLTASRIRDFRDFFIAGGRLTTPLLVCTLVSTYYGLDVTFGSSETAFYEGAAAFFAYSAPFYCSAAAALLVVAAVASPRSRCRRSWATPTGRQRASRRRSRRSCTALPSSRSPAWG